MKRIGGIPVAVGIVLLAACSLWAQTAEITGRIVDPSGAVVAAARIVVLNTETGVQYPTRTNQDGYFTVSQLGPGHYRVTVNADGFKPVVRDGVSLQVEQV